jgi:hypothetical protein
MKGIQFVTDETGKRTAVLISLAEWGEVWEDIYDLLVTESRKSEGNVPWQELKQEQEGARLANAQLSH